MSRITLAFACFFKLLFGGLLPARAVDYLPKGALPALPEPTPPPVAEAAAEKPKPKPKPKANKPNKSTSEHHRDGSLALLGLLQREGRLLDFLQESIDDYDDSDIGAAVRDIHRGCKKVLDDHLKIEAVMPGEEDDSITVPAGFDPGDVRLIGEVAGDPPFKGILRHHGWRVTSSQFPSLTDGIDRRVIAPAQVEVQ